MTPSPLALDNDAAVDTAHVTPLKAGDGVFLVSVLDNEGGTWRKILSPSAMRAVQHALAQLAAAGDDPEDSIESILGEIEDRVPAALCDVDGVKSAMRYLTAHAMTLAGEREYRPA